MTYLAVNKRECQNKLITCFDTLFIHIVEFYDDIGLMYDRIRVQNERYKLCRMVAGYAWKWQSKNDPNAYDIHIQGKQFKWNSVLKDWVNSEYALEEVGCIHTIQGYDLNYVGVIIGNEIRYEKSEIIIDETCYYDMNGKKQSKTLRY